MHTDDTLLLVHAACPRCYVVPCTENGGYQNISHGHGCRLTNSVARLVISPCDQFCLLYLTTALSRRVKSPAATCQFHCHKLVFTF